MDEKEFAPRLFADDEAVRSLGTAFSECTLEASAWTHEAHLATCLWIVHERPEVAPEREFPTMVRRFNESVGGTNDETQGYHETMTQCFIAGIRSFLGRQSGERSLVDLVNALVQAPEGARDWPLSHYSKERLYSVEARLGWVEPDLKPLVRLD